MSEVEQAELIHFAAETRRPMARWSEVVQDEKATGSEQLEDPFGVVTLASAVAEEDIEGGVLLKQPPVPSENNDPVVVREDTSRSTRELLVPFHGDQAGTGAKSAVQPGGTHPRACAALRDDSVGFRSSASLSNRPTSGMQLFSKPASEATRSAATTRDGTARSAMITNPPSSWT